MALKRDDLRLLDLPKARPNTTACTLRDWIRCHGIGASSAEIGAPVGTLEGTWHVVLAVDAACSSVGLLQL